MVIRFGQTLRGVICALLAALNTLSVATPLLAVALARLVPLPAWQRACARVLVRLGETWVAVNSILLRVLVRVRFDVRACDDLERNASYLVVSNHQSWSDILVLQHVLHRRVPFLRFFLKQQLFYVPVLGLAWWALDFPFMRRHSAEVLAKHPELRTQDLETTRRACERFRHAPVALINFLEGTRFTAAKHRAQGSPYRYLLKPKTGGIAFAIGAMGDQVRSLLDITVVYPEGARPFWDFLCGRVPAVRVDLREVPIPVELLAAQYAESAEGRAGFQAWVTQLWEAKDRRIGDLLASR